MKEKVYEAVKMPKWGQGGEVVPKGENITERSNRGLRVAAYIRVSTDSLDQENSYETQERYFRKFLEKNRGWISAGIYSDYGISGTDGRSRPGFQRILRHCREGKIDRIVCKSISRFARNAADFIMALRVLKKSGASVLFEKENLDTADLASEFLLTTLGAVAQEESRSISENIRQGMRMRFPRGDVRNELLYGYRYNERLVTTPSGYQYRDIEVVEEEAEIVRRIFREAAGGEQFSVIARGLNYEKIPAPESFYIRRRRIHSAVGQLNSELEEGWTAGKISRILRMERYTGDVLVQKTYTRDYLTHEEKRNKGEMEQFLVRDHHPAIVERRLFQEVQQVLEKNCRTSEGKQPGKKRAFSGRLICGQCGRFFHVRNVRNYPIWFCPSTSLHNGKMICHSEAVYEEQVKAVIRKALLDRFWRERTAGQTAKEAKGHTAGGLTAEQMGARLARVRNLDRLERDRAYISGKIRKMEQAGENGKDGEEEVLLSRNPGDERIAVAGKRKASAGAESQERLRDGYLKELNRRLAALEEYQEAMEKSYGIQEKALEWIETLPAGRRGTEKLLEGLVSEYPGAVVLSVLVHSPYVYTIRWFDDMKTEVRMDTNQEDHRRRYPENSGKDRMPKKKTQGVQKRRSGGKEKIPDAFENEGICREENTGNR